MAGRGMEGLAERFEKEHTDSRLKRSTAKGYACWSGSSFQSSAITCCRG